MILTYKGEIEATITGVLLIIIPLLITLSGVLTFNTEKEYNDVRRFITIGSFLIRIAATVWIVNIAARQNRNSNGWGWFAFFLPSVALIIIGQLKKINIDNKSPLNQQIENSMKEVNRLFDEEKFLESIEILDELIQFDINNNDALKMRALCYYHIKNFSKAKNDFELLNNRNKFVSLSNYCLGNIQILEFHREKAVKYWLIAEENGNLTSKIKLYRYHYFTGIYELDKLDRMRKIGGPTNKILFNINDLKYLGGYERIDIKESLNSQTFTAKGTTGALRQTLTAHIIGYTNGLEIKLKRTFIYSYHLAIAYYEIANIEFNESEKCFTILLIDNTCISFIYNQSKQINDSIKTLFRNFHKAEGQILYIDS